MENDPVLEAAGDLAAEIHEDLDLGPGRVMKAVMVADVMDEQGERRLVVMRDNEIRDWEVRGMLNEVVSDLSAFAVVDFLEEED